MDRKMNRRTALTALAAPVLAAPVALLNEGSSKTWSEKEVLERLETHRVELEDRFAETLGASEEAHQNLMREELKKVWEVYLLRAKGGLHGDGKAKSLQDYLTECSNYLLCVEGKEGNEQLMRAFENQFDIPEVGVDDFRRTILARYGALVTIRSRNLTPNKIIPSESPHWQE